MQIITSGGRALLLTGRPFISAVGGAASIALNDVVDGKIYQRIGTSKQVPVSGTYTGSPTAIQARAVPAGTSLSSTAYAWTTIATSPTGGTFSGSLLVPQGGWYILQVRDSVNPSASASGVNKFGVGILIALMGQSNMYNMWAEEYYYPLADDLCRRANSDGSWSRVGNADTVLPADTKASNNYPGGYDTIAYPITPRGDGLVYFANHLRAALNIPVGVFEAAVGATYMSQWVPGGNMWSAFTSSLSANGGDCEAAIYYQGEQDASINTTSATWQSGLQSISDTLLSTVGRTGSNFIFGVVSLGPSNGFATAGRFGEWRRTVLQFVAANPNTRYFGNPCDMSIGSDVVHFPARDQTRMAHRYVKGIRAALGLTSGGAQGPKITGATRTGNVVTVAISHSGGTALVDGAGGTGSALLGFRVFDGGTPVTINATSIVDATHVSLMLASTPTGTVTLDYCMDDAPFGTTVSPASVLYDNDTVPYDTTGLPLQPTANAITVS